MNVGNFDRQAKRAEQHVVKRATETIRAVALDAYSEIQKETDGQGGSPVASGRLASSTRLEINAIDYSTAPEDATYRYPHPSEHKYSKENLPPRTIRNVAISRVAAKLRTYKLGDKIFISNSVPYIHKIEIGGHSWQTPDGVFEKTIRAVAQRFRFLKVRGLSD